MSLRFAEIPGWVRDDHAAAWAAFCVKADLKGDAPALLDDPRAAFEALFEPVPIGAPKTAHFTGYYEPELAGSLQKTQEFSHALYANPGTIEPDRPWHSRAEIAAGDLLAGSELVWVESAIEAFLAQVQGSVRIRLTQGGTMRLGYAGKNGHPYRSIGQELVARGVASASEITPARIRQWCADNPARVQDLLNHNPSFVFFQSLDLPEEMGPLGAMGRPVTPGRTLAVDPEVIALGSPVWIDCPGFGARLMIAQDVGSAIKGAGRGDIFIGSGPEAGRIAGAINTQGRMIVLRRRK
ncbi:murein transglycosylase [Thioclava dalianensis]|uniref:peptidoglycan lytic exotransglycosylase n=1 Tax=Thioclava dalianensis TaxID=1185766 RepID=A0A074TJK3_9RHOB|nr:MltA domain-containing protein [Thioclava dalianensis]KEP70335.1 murein transglycosylase [Thioclava dalianensis]SFN33182.1 membrane-bound lytic murein transglycosylase A [Thioclava dalianensis]